MVAFGICTIADMGESNQKHVQNSGKPNVPAIESETAKILESSGVSAGKFSLSGNVRQKPPQNFKPDLKLF